MSDTAAARVLHAALQAGIGYVDTAPHYGLGLSERRIGDALADDDGGATVVSTKVGRLLEPHPHPTESDLGNGFDVPGDLVRRFDFSRDGVRRSLEGSLERLGVDRVDMVFLHDPDDHVDQAIQEGLPALLEMREEGMVDAIGVGMNQWEVPLRMVRETDLDVVMLAGRWTLLDRTGLPLLDECAQRGVAVIAAAPFNSGLLAQPDPGPDATYQYGAASSELLTRARGLAETCRRHGTDLPTAALQFPLRHPAVVSVVAGLRTTEEVVDAVTRMESIVTTDLWEEVQA